MKYPTNECQRSKVCNNCQECKIRSWTSTYLLSLETSIQNRYLCFVSSPVLSLAPGNLSSLVLSPYKAKFKILSTLQSQGQSRDQSKPCFYFPHLISKKTLLYQEFLYISRTILPQSNKL